jgi:energy-coupling factor transporter transmembrane protein EcfT
MEEANNDQSHDVSPRKWLLVTILCMVPVFLLFAYFGYPGKGRAAAIATGAIMLAVAGRSGLKSQRWFWVTLTIIIAVHVLFVLLIPWTSKSYPGPILLPFGALDYFIVWGCIKLVEKRAKKTSPPQTA